MASIEGRLNESVSGGISAAANEVLFIQLDGSQRVEITHISYGIGIIAAADLTAFGNVALHITQDEEFIAPPAYPVNGPTGNGVRRTMYFHNSHIPGANAIDFATPLVLEAGRKHVIVCTAGLQNTSADTPGTSFLIVIGRYVDAGDTRLQPYPRPFGGR